MRQVGIICDLSFVRHCQFKNYYYALTTLYGYVRIVNCVCDLDGLDILFIGDDHYSEHRKVFVQDGFFAKCNADKIKVVVFSSEKIFNTVFPWNEDNYTYLKNFDYLYHYTYDVDDVECLGTKLHRLAISKRFKDYMLTNVNSKMDKVVFLGRTDCDMGSYKERRRTLAEISKLIPVDMIPSNIESWVEYLKTIAKYRFVLSPIGNANALVTRFYETLLVRSIPVQQVKKNTLSYYDIESTFDDCIFFGNPYEIPDKIKNCTLQYSYSELWLEDYLEKLFKSDGLL